MITPNNILPLFSPRSLILRKPCLLMTARSYSTLRHAAALAAGLILAAVTALPVSGQELAWRHKAGKVAQGSGANKAVINVRSAAIVYLPGPLFSVQVTSLKPVDPNIPELIQRATQDGLVRNDPRLQLAGSNPDTLVAWTLTDLAVGSEVAGRTKSVYQKIGERIVHDSTTGMSRMEDEYGYVDVPYRALVLEGRMTVECEVKDLRTGILLYAGRVVPVYSEVLRELVGGSSPASVDNLSRVYQRLAEEAAALLLAQFSPRTYSEIVQLPAGRLKEAVKLLERDRWKEALDLLSGMAIFKDQQDEAYRLYTIGVAHEALAYRTAELVEARSHLKEAVANYRRATELKPREAIFWPPKNRAELSLWQADGLAAQMEAFDEAKKTTRTGPDQPAAAGKRDLFHQVSNKMPPPPIVVTNATVVRWVKSGLAQDYITASVRYAPKSVFDLSPVEVLKLRREGVNGRIIKAMRDTQPSYGIGWSTRKWVLIVTLLSLPSMLYAIYKTQ